MRYFILALIFWCQLCGGIAQGSTPFTYTFEPNSKSLRWEAPDPNVRLTYVDVYLNLISEASFPYLVSPPLHCLADEYDTLIIRMKCSKPGTATILFATDFDPQLNHKKQVTLALGKPNQFNTYYLNLKHQHPAWTSVINRLALSPFYGKGQAQFDYIKLTKANLFTNLKAGWQEFWGPRGRVVIGSTINLIQSSTIFARSVNVYVYWLISLAFWAIFGFNCFKNYRRSSALFEMLASSFQNAARPTLILALCFWVLLALNTDINYYNIFKSNFAKYAGKSIEEKRALAYGQEYYDFLAFAKHNLPKKAVKFGILSSSFAPDLQARIYLVPHIFTREGEGDFTYLLVFHPRPDQKINLKQYQVHAKFKENEYILKKVKL